MAKILILVMSCEDDFFKSQEKIIRETWLKPVIDKKFENIDYCFYSGQVIEKHKYNKDTHYLTLRCEDNIKNTFKKTYYAFNACNKIFKDYDYIFRTNTSTYVNIELLEGFVNHVASQDKNILWSGDLYSLSNSFCPYPLYLYGRGNGILLSRELIDIILKNGLGYLYLEKCDDWIIGNILNTYWINQGKNYLDYIKGYKHGWFKCVPEEQPNNHRLCVYGNKNKTWEFLRQFITIQVKRYRERHLEEEHYKELDQVFKENKYDSKEQILMFANDNYAYSNNPSVFIGSILGYTNYSDWVKCNKMQLYTYQVNNKASDDEERYNEENKIWM